MPRSFICVDISTNQGRDTVGSLVWFEAGRPRKSEYRKFKIKGVGQQDDFAAIHEVVTRYFTRRRDEGKPLPDLVVIDGGKGQLNAAREAANALGLESLPIVSLAKREEEVFLAGRAEPLRLPRRSPALRLLQRARDEAHRFGVTYNRKRRTARTITSELLRFPGVGAVQAPRAARAVRQPRRASGAASVAELAAVPGISPRLAERILSTTSSRSIRRGLDSGMLRLWAASRRPTGSRPSATCGSPWLVRYPSREVSPAAREVQLRGTGHVALPARSSRSCPDEEPVTLGEGATPLLQLGRTGDACGLPDLWVKDEATNPTGSFKARGLAAAVTRAVAAGATRFVLPTAGNAGVAAAAYAARAGATARVYAPPSTPAPILTQIRAFGADLVTHRRTHRRLRQGLAGLCGGTRGDGPLHAAGALSHRGQEDAGPRAGRAFDWQLPDAIIYPTGGGTGLIGMWKAFMELSDAGWIEESTAQDVLGSVHRLRPDRRRVRGWARTGVAVGRSLDDCQRPPGPWPPGRPADPAGASGKRRRSHRRDG